MNAETLRFIQRLFEKHARKMRNIVARGVVSMVDDGHMMQTNQIKLLDGELIDGAERVQQYGFTSHPQNEAECFVAFAGADRAHPLIFSVDDRRYRVQAMAAGEVCVYTDEGDKIHFKRDNTIEVTTRHFVVNAEDDVAINTKKVEINASDSMSVNTKEYTVKASTHIGCQTPSWDMANTDGGTVTARMKADIEQEGCHKSTGDQVAGTISQMRHVHDGVESGNSTTDEPVG